MGLTVLPSPSGQGVLYRTTLTIGFSTASTTDVAVLTSPIIAVPSINRLLKITLGCYAVGSTTAATVTARLKAVSGATLVTTAAADLPGGGAWQALLGASGLTGCYMVGLYVPTSTQMSVMATLATNAGTAILNASPQDPIYLMVEDAGSA